VYGDFRPSRGRGIPRDAQTQSISRGTVSTGPPYHDNIGYADLSDFGLRRSLKLIAAESLVVEALVTFCDKAWLSQLWNVYQPRVENFGHATAAPGTAAPPGKTDASAASSVATTPTVPPAPAASAAPVSVPVPVPAKIVDVTAILDGLAAKNQEKLDWRKSIVDLMKLVEMDSSLSARKQLATELHCSGDQNDSAAMNLWLHKEVIIRLAENGGKVPQESLS
jgi:hypothetical protein